MRDRYSVLSFDCYGTLIDWERGIAGALRPWADRKELLVSDEDLVAAHGRHETRVQQEHPDWLYPHVLAETMRRVGADFGVPVTNAEAGDYGDSVGEWPAFPDSADALRALAQRYELVIVSNVDRASFARSNERLGVEFDAVITAEDVGAYKPARPHFDALFALLRDRDHERSALLHVAESLYHDIEPATGLGVDTAWIHRRHGKDGHGATATPRGDVEPTMRYTSLSEFAEVV